MNPEIKKRWLEALRSGKYEQGRGKLRVDETRFCCLGVLCDILGATWGMRDRHGYATEEYSVLGETETLPGAVAFQAGLVKLDPEVICNGVLRPLSVVNDGLSRPEAAANCPSHTFLEIADMIEEQL